MGFRSRILLKRRGAHGCRAAAGSATGLSLVLSVLPDSAYSAKALAGRKRITHATALCSLTTHTAFDVRMYSYHRLFINCLLPA